VEGPESFALRSGMSSRVWGGRRVGVARENVETPNVSTLAGSFRRTGGVEDALLGPERTTTGSRVVGVIPRAVGAGCCCLGAVISTCSRLVSWVGRWSVWSLRIVQWTRASFVSVVFCCVVIS
jgi:hypothetical protein